MERSTAGYFGCDEMFGGPAKHLINVGPSSLGVAIKMWFTFVENRDFLLNVAILYTCYKLLTIYSFIGN